MPAGLTCPLEHGTCEEHISLSLSHNRQKCGSGEPWDYTLRPQVMRIDSLCCDLPILVGYGDPYDMWPAMVLLRQHCTCRDFSKRKIQACTPLN